MLDPKHQEPALDQMVLIGHSMGGLVSQLQTVQSGDDFWRLVSNEPLWQIKADAEGAAEAARDVLLPAQPVDPPRDDHRHAAPRQHVLEPDHAMAAGQADPPAAEARRQPAAVVPRQPRGVSRRFAAEDRHEHRLAVAQRRRSSR